MSYSKGNNTRHEKEKINKRLGDWNGIYILAYKVPWMVHKLVPLALGGSPAIPWSIRLTRLVLFHHVLFGNLPHPDRQPKHKDLLISKSNASLAKSR